MNVSIRTATHLAICWGLALLTVVPVSLQAQSTKLQSKGQVKGKELSTSPFGNLGMPSMGGGSSSGEQATFEAGYELETAGKSGRLSITANIANGWHLYSNTQPEGGPMATRIKLLSDLVNLTGPFIPDQAPDIGADNAWPGLPIEEHHDVVTWTAPFTVGRELDPTKDTLEVALDGQVCMTGGSCIPISKKVTAKFQGNYGDEPRSKSLRITDTQAVWTANLSPAQVKPGDLAVVTLTADLDEGYHIYPFIEEESEFRTVIVATSKAGLRFGRPKTEAPISVDNRLETPIDYHSGDVSWRIPIRVPENAQAGEYPIELQVGFMTCNDRSCSKQSGLSVAGTLTVTSTPPTPAAGDAMTFASLDYLTVVDRDSLTAWIDQATTETKSTKAASLAAGGGLDIWMVLAALAGGFILNFMPCVLPVIGLKLMGFVNQSGSNRGKIISLNVSYVGGILAVMLVLALANVFAKLAGEAFGWGQQFTRLEFQVPMAVLIFAMAEFLRSVGDSHSRICYFQ